MTTPRDDLPAGEQPSPRDPGLAETCRTLGLRMLVLFGSHAPGGLPPRASSDVDLGWLARPGARVSPLDILDALAPYFGGRQLDIANLGAADPVLRWEAMERAVLLFGDIDEFLQFRAYAYRDFVDSADLRALEHALSRRKLQRLGELIGASS